MDTVFYDIAVVVVVSSVLTWLAIVFRQPLVVAYLLAGVLIGQWLPGLVQHVDLLDDVSRIGVALLLFLAGLVLHPQRLVQLFRETATVALISSIVFFLFLGGAAFLFLHSGLDALIVGLALMFSSTILVVKLLPTTTLHQKRMGGICIALLIIQDIIAVALLIFIGSHGAHGPLALLLLPVKGIALVVGALLFERYVLRKIMHRCERYHEALYLIALGWCFGLALLAIALGFSKEVGAFLAGVALAQSPLSLFLSEGLKFFRDFFLVLFFFVLGVRIDILIALQVLVPALFVTVALIAVKPLVYDWAFRLVGEEPGFARETGFRLAQGSEFSLIIAMMACEAGLLSVGGANLVQLVTIFSMLASSYLVVFFYPTPLGMQQGLKQD